MVPSFLLSVEKPKKERIVQKKVKNRNNDRQRSRLPLRLHCLQGRVEVLTCRWFLPWGRGKPIHGSGWMRIAECFKRTRTYLKVWSSSESLFRRCRSHATASCFLNQTYISYYEFVYCPQKCFPVSVWWQLSQHDEIRGFPWSSWIALFGPQTSPTSVLAFRTSMLASACLRILEGLCTCRSLIPASAKMFWSSTVASLKTSLWRAACMCWIPWRSSSWSRVRYRTGGKMRSRQCWWWLRSTPTMAFGPAVGCGIVSSSLAFLWSKFQTWQGMIPNLARVHRLGLSRDLVVDPN